jgi:uncharacterized protein with PQ loop repeat
VSLQDAGVVAGTVSTTLFVISYLPMLVKAFRTRDLRSYSAGNLVVANVGNVVHSLYVFSLPAGPLWLLHSFYVVSSALMLFWWWRYRSRQPVAVPGEARAGHPRGAAVGDEVAEHEGHRRFLEPAPYRAQGLGAATARARLDDPLDPDSTALLACAASGR